MNNILSLILESYVDRILRETDTFCNCAKKKKKKNQKTVQWRMTVRDMKIII